MNREAELIKYIDDVIIQQIYIRCNDQSDITERDAIDLLDNDNNFGIGKQMQKCKRILAHEKIHLQLPPKLQRSKASDYHQQITIIWKIGEFNTHSPQPAFI